MRKRDLAARILNSWILRPFSRIRPGELRILAYHSICDTDPAEYKFDDGAVSATTDSFREQMKFVSRHFQVLSFQQLFEFERAYGTWPDRALIITFDDGYKDNFTIAWPILKELGLTATFFLATGHIGQAELFWWDEIAYLLKHTHKQSFSLTDMQPSFPLNNLVSRQEAIEKVLAYVKRIPDEERRKFIVSLRNELETEVPSEIAAGMHMNWDEVRELADGGMEIGSHTITHPILSRVSPDRLKAEIADSRLKIEKETGKEVISFAYPAGQKGMFNQAAYDVVVQSGYQYAAAFDEGIPCQAMSDPFALPRIHVERDDPVSYFCARLNFPGLFFKAPRTSEISGNPDSRQPQKVNSKRTPLATSITNE